MNAVQRLLGALLIAVTGTTLVACNAAETPTKGSTVGSQQAQADEAYLYAIESEFPSLEDAPEDELIGLGKDICEMLSGTPITEDSLSIVLESFYEGAGGTFSREDVGYIFGAATSAYCPETYDDMVEVLSGS